MDRQQVDKMDCNDCNDCNDIKRRMQNPELAVPYAVVVLRPGLPGACRTILVGKNMPGKPGR